MSAPPTENPGWHALPAEAALAAVSARPGGLTSEEAKARLERFGPNQLKPPETRSALKRFLLQFHNVLIYVLIAAGAVTAALGDRVDAAVIAGVVLVNAVIGFVQEGKAEAALQAIRGMLSEEAIVLRDGRRRALPARDLVPGDVVLLQPGGKVPADLCLLRMRSLQAQEAALTGEAAPAEKGRAPAS
jgi:magnesium-transporting ATPase (P-type)